MSTRTPVRLHGGPFDDVICFPPDGAVELGLEQRSTGRVALYEIKGVWGSFVGMRPLSWIPGSGMEERPWMVDQSGR